MRTPALEAAQELLIELDKHSLGGESNETKGLLAELRTLLMGQIDPFRDITQVRRKEFIRLRFYLNDRISTGYYGDTEFDRMVDILLKIIMLSLEEPLPPHESLFKDMHDSKLRSILERDLQDAFSSFERRNWKSCMMLCGSVLEAALYEFLMRNPTWTNTEGPKWSGWPKDKRDSKKPIGERRNCDITRSQGELKLSDLIVFTCSHEILPKDRQKVFESGIRDSRNLIHPTAEIRGEFTVDEAQALHSLGCLKLALRELYSRKPPWE